MSGSKRSEPAEISVSFNVSRLPQDGLAIRFEADATERSRVAARFGILGVETLRAALVAARWQKDGVVVRGRLNASVLQADVVTLEPVRNVVAEDVELFFVPEGSRLALPAGDDDEIELDPADDAPDTFHGDRIDLGEPLVQLLGLALDPYPRGEDVEFEERQESGREPSPFAVLAKLRDRTD